VHTEVHFLYPDYCQGHQEFPFGNSWESAIPRIAGGNSRQLLNYLREFLGISKIYKFS